MKKEKIIRSLVIFIFTLCLSCFSFYEKTLSLSYKAHIYAVNAESYPEIEFVSDLPEAKKFPKLSLEEIEKFLANLYYYNYDLDNAVSHPIFDKNDIKYLSRKILKVTKKIEKNQRLFLIYKNIPVGNLVRTVLRTTAFIWYDKYGINFYLGNAREAFISRDLLHQNSDWSNVDPSELSERIEALSLAVSEPYYKKKWNDVELETWVYISRSSLLKLKLDKHEKNLEEDQSKEEDKFKEEDNKEEASSQKEDNFSFTKPVKPPKEKTQLESKKKKTKKNQKLKKEKR